MLAEILTIGDEILIGQTVDTNSAWLGEELSLLGIQVNRIVSIADTPEALRDALNDSFGRAPLVIVTGGLGPTQDDSTKQTLSAYFNMPLERNQEVLDKITEFFTRRNRPMLESNRRQADLPRGARLLPNIRGTAQGMWFEQNGKVCISLPGVPYEMKGIMREHGLEALARHFHTPVIVHKTVLTQGIGESFLAEIIAPWEDRLRKAGLGLAYLPSPGIVKLRITARGKLRSDVESICDKYRDELMALIPEYVFGEDKDTLPGVVGQLLVAQGHTLAVCESCTGGYLAHQITSISGASRYFLGGWVTYATRQKVDVLGIDTALIEEHGVVSAAVSEAMAVRAAELSGADFALSSTGYAETDPENPQSGEVYIGLHGPRGTFHKKLKLGNSRERNIHMATLEALSWLRKEILALQLV